ncbi:VTC domain-containing protein [Psychroserpens sp.]
MGNLQNSYRYERKYKLNVSEYEILVHDMLSEGMKVHHPTRFINNIYFDSLNFDAYFENVEGESERNKYRLRWYGDRFNTIRPIFEVKMKKDQVNKKLSLKIPEIEFRSFNDVENVSNHILNYMEGEESTLFFEMMNKIPTLLNGYKRDYFLSKDGETRLTIDRNLFFYNCRNNQEYNQSEIMVVEVKYASNVTPKINFDKFKLVLGKNSKYVSGIDYTKLK